MYESNENGGNLRFMTQKMNLSTPSMVFYMIRLSVDTFKVGALYASHKSMCNTSKGMIEFVDPFRARVLYASQKSMCNTSQGMITSSEIDYVEKVVYVF